jgi:hypothetical protein
LPRWLAGLAGPPPAPATVTMTGHGAAHAEARLRASSGACWAPAAANGTGCCFGRACGPVNWSPTATSTPTRPLRRHRRRRPDRAGRRGRAAAVAATSGPDSTAPGQPMNP